MNEQDKKLLERHIERLTEYFLGLRRQLNLDASPESIRHMVQAVVYTEIKKRKGIEFEQINYLAIAIMKLFSDYSRDFADYKAAEVANMRQLIEYVVTCLFEEVDDMDQYNKKREV